MSTELLIKGLFAGAFSLAFAWVVFSRYDGEIGSESSNEGGQKSLLLIHGALLPAFILSLIFLGLKFYGTAPTMKMALTMCFDIFLHISPLLCCSYHGIAVFKEVYQRSCLCYAMVIAKLSVYNAAKLYGDPQAVVHTSCIKQPD